MPLKHTELVVDDAVIDEFCTVIVTIFDPVHAAVVVSVTKYTVVVVGVTTIEFVVLPVFHKIPLTPLVVKVTVAPAQISELLAEVVTVGLGLAITVMFAIPPQGPLVPATVYIVVANGLIIIFGPTKFPGIQV